MHENGFIFEEHPVVTKDGYKLNLYRIRASSTPKDAPVVFLQHGLLGSANCWIMHHGNRAPAFQLVREGYDVWLGNQRGTTYSIGHTTLDTESRSYWSFSFTEMGEYDAPAQVEYALNHTGQKKAAAFIGHSQGSSQMFYALSAHPDYWNEKIDLFVALAPVTSLTHSPAKFLKSVKKHMSQLKSAVNWLQIYVVLQDGIASFMTSKLCYLVPAFCNEIYSYISTSDPTLDDQDRFQVYMGHYPNGASVQSMLHYAQLISKEDMELFDWDSTFVNEKKYGQEIPPKVDFSKITVPTAMFVGLKDQIGDS